MNDVPHGWPMATANQVQGWASNMLPSCFQGWPTGTRRATNEAEDILTSAVAWWDASRYREGDRLLRNQGTAGELLDARLGSSTVANSNDPLFLPVGDETYVYLPSSVGLNAMYVANATSNNITTELDYVLCLDRLWTGTGSNGGLIGRYGSNSGPGVGLGNSDGTVILILHDGTNYLSATATAKATGSGRKWLRVTWRSSDGRAQFFFNDDDGGVPTAWNQLGANVTVGTGITNFSGSTAPFFIGSGSSSWGTSGDTRVVYASAASTIGGDPFLLVDLRNTSLSANATSFTESSTNASTVTIGRATSGRKTVVMPSRWNGGRSCFLLGTDDYFEVQGVWQHQLLGFGGNDSFTVVLMARRWGSTSNHVFISKNDGDIGNGWILKSATGNFYGGVSDSVVAAQTNTVQQSWSNTFQVNGFIVDRQKSSIQTFADTSFSSQVSTAGLRSVRSTRSLGIGMSFGSFPDFADFEFFSAAIFRRALTAAEIATVVRYYGAA